MHDEFRFHIDSYAADLVRKGLSPEEARRRALVEFGGVEAWKIDGREALGLRLFDELRGDLRYTWRQLRRSPGFASIAILSIALGHRRQYRHLQPDGSGDLEGDAGPRSAAASAVHVGVRAERDHGFVVGNVERLRREHGRRP